MYRATFVHVPTCVYVIYRPSEPAVPKQKRKLCMSAVYCDKNLEQRINIEFCVDVGTTASERQPY
jgi:hypothetical protein